MRPARRKAGIPRDIVTTHRRPVWRLLARLSRPVLAVFMVLAATAAGPVGAAPPPTLALSTCRLTHPSQLVAIDAQCGELAVAENPALPHGRQIRLFVARVPAVSEHGQPDPLFVLAGGPGLGATTFYTGVAAVFERIHRDRDIVLVDQRGTGASNALACPGALDPQTPDSVVAVTQEARACLARLAAHADVSQYTTSLAVRDLDAVRVALGYETINLYGGSYGTRVAQHYLRRYPAHTRTVILDGVVPPQMTLGASLALDAQDALQSSRAAPPRPPATPASAIRTAPSTCCWRSCARRPSRSGCPTRSPGSCAS
jgi:pimeloyl-ACP methyl ester carboxylesterase